MQQALTGAEPVQEPEAEVRQPMEPMPGQALALRQAQQLAALAETQQQVPLRQVPQEQEQRPGPEQALALVSARVLVLVLVLRLALVLVPGSEPA